MACRLLCPIRGTRAAAKYRRSVKGLRYFSFPRRCGGSGERSEPIGALMPHAALWVVQHVRTSDGVDCTQMFQCRTRLCGWCSFRLKRSTCFRKSSFNAARGFVGGATADFRLGASVDVAFQCRTRLCGWCSFEKECL